MDPQNDLQFLPLGIGDFFSRYHYCTSFLMLAGGQTVLTDCPSPLRKMLFEAGNRAGLEMDVESIRHLILTHLHGDHANGLEELAFFKRFVQHDKIHLCTIAEVLEMLWEHRLKASMGVLADAEGNNGRPQQLADYFDVYECREGTPIQCGPLRLEIRRTRHFIPCFGFRAHYNGLSLGYSADTVFDPAHIEFLSSCDVIIHESSLGVGHTPLDKLVELPEAIRRKLFLVHLPDEFDISRSPLPVLEQGRLYSVRELRKAMNG